MSKNIVLQNGTNYEYKLNNVSKLRTDLQDGGTCDWVPEDETLKHLTAEDEGKVVQNSALVLQTSLNVTANNTYDTTTNNSVVVAVRNTYSSSDEGKIVKNGSLEALSLQSKNVSQNGTVTPDTGYDGLSSVNVEVNTMSCLVVNCGTVSSLPITVNNTRITSDMVVVQSDLGNPWAQGEDGWLATTANGSLTVSGTLTGSTTLTLYLLEGE